MKITHYTFDYYVDLWHNSDSKLEIYEYMGITKERYASLVYGIKPEERLSFDKMVIYSKEWLIYNGLYDEFEHVSLCQNDVWELATKYMLTHEYQHIINEICLYRVKNSILTTCDYDVLGSIDDNYKKESDICDIIYEDNEFNVD